MEILLIAVIIVCAVVCAYLYSKRKSAAASAGDDIDAENDDEQAYDDDTVEQEDSEDANMDDDDFEYDDMAPFIEQNASVLDMRIEPRVTSRISRGRAARSRDELLIFFVDFKLDDDEEITLSVPAEVYDLISVGESARLMTQNNRFIDFGDKCAQLVDAMADADEGDEKIIYDDYDGDTAELIVGEIPENEAETDGDTPDAENEAGPPVAAQKKKSAKDAESETPKAAKKTAAESAKADNPKRTKSTANQASSESKKTNKSKR